MSRPRRPETPYQRRNRLAREKGYASYYDYRMHANGRIPPGPIELSKTQRDRMRGHRGRADFLASLGEGDLIILPQGITSVEFDDDARGGEGAYLEIEKLVIDGDTGEERTYFLRKLTREELIDTIFTEQAKGAVFSPQPSLDQRRLVPEDDAPGGY